MIGMRLPLNKCVPCGFVAVIPSQWEEIPVVVYVGGVFGPTRRCVLTNFVISILGDYLQRDETVIPVYHKFVFIKSKIKPFPYFKNLLLMFFFFFLGPFLLLGIGKGFCCTQFISFMNVFIISYYKLVIVFGTNLQEPQDS